MNLFLVVCYIADTADGYKRLCRRHLLDLTEENTRPRLLFRYVRHGCMTFYLLPAFLRKYLIQFANEGVNSPHKLTSAASFHDSI